MTTQIANQVTSVDVVKASIFVDVYFATTQNKLAEDKAQDFVNSFNFSKVTNLLDWRQITPDESYAQDVAIVQLVCNEPRANRAAQESWAEMVASLEVAFGETFSKDVFGYTLTYQAVVRDGAGSGQSFADLLPMIELNALFEVCKRPGGEPSQEVLAETVVLEEQGKVWLLDIPNVRQPTKGDHLQKGMVCLALSVESANDAMVSQVIHSKNALFFMPNLVAHKGYNQIRQYRLYHQEKNIRPKLTTIVYDAKQQLDNLKMITGLERLHVSLERQLYNYDKATKGVKTPLFAFHQSQLEAPLREMDLMIEEAKHVQRATDTAVIIMQTEVQEKVGLALAAVGIALGLSQVIDKSAVDALLRVVSLYLPFLPTLAVNESYNRLWTVGIQLSIIPVAAIALTWMMFWLSGWYVGWKRGKMG